MKNLVNERVLNNHAELCNQFTSARPFRHVAIDDFLEQAFARSLLEPFPSFDELHRDPCIPPNEDEIVTITPAFNRCIIFETNEYSWHGFRRINLQEGKRQLSRKSCALYYYTDDRPAEEWGTEHSTIYVEEAC